MTTATDLLHHAAALLAERGKTYDTKDKAQERSMPKIVELFNSLHGTQLTVQQGWEKCCQIYAYLYNDEYALLL